MSDRDTRVERGQGRPEDGRGVALDEDDIGVMAIEPAADRGDDAAGQLRQRLPRPHEVEVVVGLEAEGAERLVEHLAMLRGGHQDRAKLRGVA